VRTLSFYIKRALRFYPTQKEKNIYPVLPKYHVRVAIFFFYQSFIQT